jgi:hypothetical protein
MYRISSLTIIPALRYYINTKNEKNKFYLQLGGGTGFILGTKQITKSYDEAGNVTLTSTTSYPKKYLSQYGEIYLGFNHFITSSIALNMAFGYDYNKGKNTRLVTVVDGSGNQTQSETSQTAYNNHIFWSLGFTLIIPGKN